MDHLHLQHWFAKLSASATLDSHMTVLALITLGNVTPIISISVAPPKVAKISTSVSLSWVIVTGIVVLPSPM